jgi:hypothetical protein
MKSRKNLFTGLICLSLLVVAIGHVPVPYGFAQEDGVKIPITPLGAPTEDTLVVEPPKTATIQTTGQSSNATVQLYMCDTDLTRILVMDGAGKLISTVRSVSYTQKVGQVPMCECGLFGSYFAPTSPLTKKWPVSKITTVTAEVFQQMIDEDYQRRYGHLEDQ